MRGNFPSYMDVSLTVIDKIRKRIQYTMLLGRYGSHGTKDEYITFLEQTVETFEQCCSCGTAARLRRDNTSYSENARGTEGSPTSVATMRQPTERSELSIEVWSPSQSLVRKQRKNHPTWRKHADELLKITPAGDAWREAMCAKNIYGAMETGAAVAHLLQPETVVPMASGDKAPQTMEHVSGRSGRLIERITRYASLAAQRQQTASLALLLANFQVFVVLSACVVLHAKRVLSKDHVFCIVRTCLGDVTDDYCTRMLLTAKYMNTMIDTLAAHEWDGRAAELILFC